MNKKILIIEDNEIINEMYTLKFTLDGFNIKSVLDGHKGIEMILSFKPDVVLLDIMMPGMNGYETLKTIKELVDYDVKIIVFTNLNSPDDIKKALELGASECLLKADVTPKGVVEKVKSLFPSP